MSLLLVSEAGSMVLILNTNRFRLYMFLCRVLQKSNVIYQELETNFSTNLSWSLIY